MDQQKSQSIEFDIQQLQMQLDDVNEQIKFKKEQNDFARRGSTAVGVGSGAVANFLFRNAISRTPLGLPIAISNLIAGAKTGETISDIANNANETEVLSLIQTRDNIKAKIKRRREELNAL